MVLSDRADVLPQLEANVARNASRAAVRRGDYALDFDDVEQWDLVVGSDLVCAQLAQTGASRRF